MPSKIRVLSDDTINKIAAGEVIENPSSVVKELVENAIDAGATEISIEIKGGGRQLIRITDNGSGMNKDDALLSLERHATSKIREIDELDGIGTMGFRGEAVPSIASISKFTLYTREQLQQEPGTLLMVDGGKIVNCAAVECASGTTIEVKDLFFNVPVRKKFQKSPAYDASEIQRIVTLLALGNPSIQFTLISNQETIISVSRSNKCTFLESLGDRIRQLLGAEFYKNLLPIQGTRGECQVEGFIGDPMTNRHNRSGQHLFIHKRGVMAPMISFAVKDGYGTMLPTGRHPLYVLHFTMPSNYLDVNVHPQKKEVRIRQERTLKELIIFSVEGALQKVKGLIPSPLITHHESRNSYEPSPSASHSYPRDYYSPFEDKKADLFTVKEESNPFGVTSGRPYQMPVLNNMLDSEYLSDTIAPVSPSYSELLCTSPSQSSAYAPSQRNENKTLFVSTNSPENKNSKSLKALATFQKYIIAIDTEGDQLFLIDQRAAHSRTIYERLVNNQSGIVEQQMLLIPHLLELPAAEASFIKEHLPSLQEAGIQIKEFGPTCFMIDALPEIFGNIDLHKLVDEIIKNSYEGVHSKSFEKEVKKKLAQAASRAAVRSEARLNLIEAQHLLDNLMECQHSKQCPYGKATFVTLTPNDILKLFNA